MTRLSNWMVLLTGMLGGCASQALPPYINVDGGDIDACCVPGKACATDHDCVDGDACHVNPRCDGATALCVFVTLDKDGDGHPPPVCGGDDCDDTDPRRHPGAAESCDGRDEDCNGLVDEGASCSDPLTTCQGGACVCRPQFQCGADCTDRQSDPRHCGTCGNACAGAETCMAGVCECTKQRCGGACADTSSDVGHCGACGHDCAALHLESPRCTLGVCAGSCTSGYADCDNNKQSNGCEVDTANDPLQCGLCGVACSKRNISQPGCAGGSCNGACDPGWADCNQDKRTDGCETDVSSNLSSCGTCGNACPIGSTCVAGRCGGCPNGATSCGGVCTDTTTDLFNCGACGNSCPGGWNCCNSACTNPTNDVANCGQCGYVCTVDHGTPKCVTRLCTIATCIAGWSDCNGIATDGCEIDVDNNPNNCGGCGNACFLSHALPACVAGRCNIDVCLPPYANCNGLGNDGCELNVLSDPANCGACGVVCPTGNCTMGLCL